MPIQIKRKDGSITTLKNGEFLPAYYYIPKEILERSGKELNSISRYPQLAVRDWKAIECIESNLFLNFIMDAYASMVWTYMGLDAKREIFSGYEPSWIFAHSSGYWIQELTDEKIIPTIEELLKSPPDVPLEFVPITEVSQTLAWLVPQTMAHYNMKAIIETAKEFRCLEDFDYRKSRQKTDFYRKWYHTRTQHPMISLEEWQDTYRESHNGQDWDIQDNTVNVEQDSLAKIQVNQFMETLVEKDAEILNMRMSGLSLEEIAQRTGYKNHSGVLKRIRKIGQAYERFANVDYGFHEKNI